jgi:hypothetical protein
LIQISENLKFIDDFNAKSGFSHKKNENQSGKYKLWCEATGKQGKVLLDLRGDETLSRWQKQAFVSYSDVVESSSKRSFVCNKINCFYLNKS